MKIYTKTGDNGTTALFNGTRVKKNSLRTAAYGTIDELNAVLGIALSLNPAQKIKESIDLISIDLFRLGSDLATPMSSKAFIPRINENDILQLEAQIDAYDLDLPKLEHFVMPGGSVCAAHLNYARTIARRAEREIITLAEQEDIGEFIIKYINRLSDFLFIASRLSNKLDGYEEKLWETK